ncbi:hypothetical protein DW903_02245 [Ruminococcus sp. AM42-10AC]|nr:hypothetical protein DW903_02245 [Ruminococcus sp. AM42-10AC]
MELLVCMSISGSIPVVICLLLYVIQCENYNYILGRRLLLTGIFFYLVPVQLVKYLLPKDIFPETMLIGRKADSYLSGSLSFWSEAKGDYIWMPQWFNIFAKIWLAGIIIFAVYEIIKYWRGVHSIRNYIFEKIEDPENDLTYYLIPDDLYGPCTIGFFFQKITIPESFPLYPDFIMVYKHEHTHLKNHDNLVKLLCLFVLCLHWMNPVAYLLLLLYIDTAEIVSDSVAVDGCPKEKRKDYAKLLVLEASASDIRPVVWKNNLSGHKNAKEGKNFKTLKRRINYMMKMKKKGILQRGIMVAVSVLTVVASAGTVMAYEPISSSDESFEDIIFEDELNNFGDNYIDYDSINFIDFSQSDYVLIDSNGMQITTEESFAPYALCTHSMIPATFYTHAKNSSGGCTIKVYNCQRCEKCGYRANAKYSHTVTSTKCTHK